MEAEHFKTNAPKIVRDLDAILQSPGHVRLHGNIHEIKPIEVQEFFVFANALAEIREIEKREKITLDELVGSYFSLISPVCPTITKEDILKSTQEQVAELVKIIP